MSPLLRKDRAPARSYETTPADGPAGTAERTEPWAAAGPGARGMAHRGAANSRLPGPAPNRAGPHRHDVLNKLDPTVDSRSGGIQIVGPHVRTLASDGSAHPPAPGSADMAPRTAADPAAVTHSRGAGGEYGPRHGSKMANNTVDETTMASGAIAPGAAGSDLDGRDRGSRAVAATGPARKTAGPHRSDWMNKLDPTVDSRPAHTTSMTGHRAV